MIAADLNLIQYQEKRITEFYKLGIENNFLAKEKQILTVLKYSNGIVSNKDEIYTVQMTKENFRKFEKIMTKPQVYGQKRPQNDQKSTEINKKGTENDKKGTNSTNLNTANKDTRR